MTLFQVALVLQRAEADPAGSGERAEFEREFEERKSDLLEVQLESEQALGLISISADPAVYRESRRIRDAVGQALGAMPREVNDVAAARLYNEKLGELAEAESDYVEAVRDDLD
ncbi:hypothetical protein EHW97_11260 [Aeromicrobium camelliae]|uniref:Uncharacterized protein n=1 Tax=Aeromicrobium camelliae TaxID=1538144 RepID=A0A3N6WMI3_9ACTN|nr:hypothetical protein [Aeromicrobium camelliae]RQN03005.1 hypothetical protein EHW97_11260 [Aeromicrobium camelliae]